MVNHFIPFELITQNYAEMRAINNSPDAFSAGRNLYQAPIGLPLLQKTNGLVSCCCEMFWDADHCCLAYIGFSPALA